MKKRVMKKLLAIAGCVTIFSAVDATLTYAATSNADAKGTVIIPIAIEQVDQLAFGKFAANTGGTMTIAADGGLTYTGVGVISTSTHTAASFTVTGEGGQTFAITLPEDGAAKLSKSGAPDMALTGFSSSPAASGSLSGSAGASGSATVTVGAMLTVGNAQPPGDYTGKFDVTVEYN